MTSQMFISIHRKILLVLTCIAITADCAGCERQSKPAAVPEIHPEILAGYLQTGEHPDSLALIPPPSAEGSAALALAIHSQPLDGEAKILQSWQGDYPVDKLNLLPEKQRQQAVGFIDNVETFENVWKAFKPGEDVPEIDFKANLVLFARNTHFYNRIRIGKVNVKNGVAEVLAMETMSAMPIEDKVAISLVVVQRKDIKSIRTTGGLVSI